VVVLVTDRSRHQTALLRNTGTRAERGSPSILAVEARVQVDHHDALNDTQQHRGPRYVERSLNHSVGKVLHEDENSDRDGEDAHDGFRCVLQRQRYDPCSATELGERWTIPLANRPQHDCARHDLGTERDGPDGWMYLLRVHASRWTVAEMTQCGACGMYCATRRTRALKQNTISTATMLRTARP